MSNKLESLYNKLYLRFGPQHWWPADTDFEVAVGAILTQNTNWSNVEKAINNLKKAKVLTPQKLYKISEKKLSKLIIPAGYYNVKAKRIKHFLGFLFDNYSGSLKRMPACDTGKLRQELLAVNGIGPETADSILLYALNKPVFVVDAYTKRIFSRHGFFKADAEYHRVQNLFMKKVKKDVKLFNEFHALLVKLGKDFCRKSKPRCKVCPLR